MGYADLHMHSRWSDGEWSPRRLVHEARTAQLSAVSLTDHDETGGLEEATAAGLELGITVLPGVELSTFDGMDRHLLAYGFDPADPALCALMADSRADRGERARHILVRLEEIGVPVSMEAVEEEAQGAAIGRPHIARALVKARHVKTFRDAFDLWLGDGKPACVEKRRLEPRGAIEAVHGAGGVVVIAHPGMNGGPDQIVPLVEAGLDGVEVRHPMHGGKSEAAFDEFARSRGLLRTGGSDFHGPRWGGLGVGTVSIPEEWWQALLERINERRTAAGLGVVAG